MSYLPPWVGVTYPSGGGRLCVLRRMPRPDLYYLGIYLGIVDLRMCPFVIFPKVCHVVYVRT